MIGCCKDMRLLTDATFEMHATESHSTFFGEQVPSDFRVGLSRRPRQSWCRSSLCVGSSCSRGSTSWCALRGSGAGCACDCRQQMGHARNQGGCVCRSHPLVSQRVANRAQRGQFAARRSTAVVRPPVWARLRLACAGAATAVTVGVRHRCREARIGLASNASDKGATLQIRWRAFVSVQP